MMVFLFPVLFLVWKVIHRTKFYKPAEVDLQQDLAGIEEYTRNYVPEKSK